MRETEKLLENCGLIVSLEDCGCIVQKTQLSQIPRKTDSDTFCSLVICVSGLLDELCSCYLLYSSVIAVGFGLTQLGEGKT